MKNQNPLYVVKGRDVHPVKNIFELVIKKLNLEPFIRLMQSLLKFLLEQVKSWPMLLAAQKAVDEFIIRYISAAKKFGFV
jgi:hypothetical protein